MSNEELIQMYKEAIVNVENWRLANGSFKLISASPAQIHLYNIFTNAKNILEDRLSLIEDVAKMASCTEFHHVFNELAGCECRKWIHAKTNND